MSSSSVTSRHDPAEKCVTDELSLAQRFVSSGGTVLRLGRTLVHAVYDVPAASGIWTLSIEQSEYDRARGVVVKALRGSLLVDGISRQSMLCLTQDRPAEWGFSMSGPRVGEAVLRLWPTWRPTSKSGAIGLNDSFQGNAGMVVSEVDDRIVIGCSDGIGGIDFSQVTVSLRRKNC